MAAPIILVQNHRMLLLHVVDPVPSGFRLIVLKLFLLQNLLEPDPWHVSNLSCNFGDDLMIRSGKTNCIYMQNLQWKPVGK